MRRALVVGLLVLTAPACAGPKQSVTFGGKSVAVNVSFGKPAPDDPRAPTTPFVLGPVLGGVGVVPVEAPKKRQPGVSPLPPPPPSPACPAVDLVKPPVDEAPRHLGAPPLPGKLSYRVDGRVDGAEVKGSFTREVKNVEVQPNGVIQFEVVSELLGVTTTQAFASRPAADRIPGAVALARVEGGDASFTSEQKPLTLLQLDATVGTQWADAVTDPLSQTTYALSGTVVGKGRVWACGENIDAWQVKLTQQVVSRNQQVEAEITYWIATQYGGLIVQETVSWSGLARDDEVSGEYTATINQVPVG